MKWASAFKYLPVNYDDRVATVQNLTQRVSFDNNLNGNRIHLRFSNRYGKIPLRLERVTIGVMHNDIVTNTVLVTLAGNSVITLEPGQEHFSDEIIFTVCAGERLAVNIYIGQEQSIESICCLWAKTNSLISFGAGDQTDGQSFDAAIPDNILPIIRDDTSPDNIMFFYGFDALQVFTDDDVRVVAAFGDSITHMSYVTNALTKRVYASYPGKVTLINSGVGGNRLVHDATYIEEIHQVVSVFGEAGVRRFEKDVFEIDSVDSVLSLIGINDIMHPIQFEGKAEATPAAEIIEGYGTIAGIAHSHGAKIYGATIAPAGNSEFPESWLPAIEKSRLQLNNWIRGENDFDGYFDYDAAIRDDAKPGYLLPGVHIGDGLHPNDKGAQLVAAVVDLAELVGLK